MLDATVVIPTYQRAELLRRTLDALTRQEGADFEVVVVDDGSTDHTRQVVEGFTDRLSLRYLHQPDEGFRAAAARNLGIRHAEGDVCVLLDCGVLPARSFVARHVAAHRSTPDRVAVVGYTWAYRASLPLAPEVAAAVDHEDVDASIARMRWHPDARDVREDFFYDRFGEDLSAQPAPWVTFWGCNASARREDLFVVGLFDESFRGWGFEDLDLGYRLYRSGVRFALDRSAEAVHAPHARDADAGQRSDRENKEHFHRKFRNRVSETALSTPYNLQINGLLREDGLAGATPAASGADGSDGASGPSGADGPVTRTEREAMRTALRAALRGPAHGPNPRVGAVILDRDGRTLGVGHHDGAGTPHAEVAALAAAGGAARGGTAVVTLEPCSHHGRTGPCSEALLAAGIARVIVAAEDPNPQAAGGAARLREAGVEVVTGLHRDDAVRQTAIWRHAITTGRPWVTLKWAAGLDGRVAAADGSSRWITGEQARADVHRRRAAVDAVLVGVGTVLADDPSLTARPDGGPAPVRQPLRVVVGRRPVPPGARVLDGAAPTLVLPEHDPAAILARLAELEVRHVWVEGGPVTASAFLAAGVVDEVLAYVAPLVLGGGPAALTLNGAGRLGDARRLRTVDVVRLGDDVLTVLRPLGPPATGGPALDLAAVPSLALAGGGEL